VNTGRVTRTGFLIADILSRSLYLDNIEGAATEDGRMEMATIRSQPVPEGLGDLSVTMRITLSYFVEPTSRTTRMDEAPISIPRIGVRRKAPE
jgi:hypothetical protein